MTSDSQISNKVEVNFLVDQPSDTDFFGSHSQVADAVADAIGSRGATNVIGLLGGWGSGKSTVVRQIESKLKTKPCGASIHLFTYDAWLHQNDPPRRAFLEELIGALTEAKLVNAADWEPRLADLSGRSEVTVTDTSRHISDTGKWIFLSLGVVPLGLGFLDFELIDKAFGAQPQVLAQALLGLSVTLLLAPMLVVGAFYAWWRPYKTQWKRDGWKLLSRRDFWTKHDAKHADQSILSLLTNQSTERAENKTKISPEPTAIEFRSVFNDLLKALSTGDRKLVIVIDNLDRLAEQEAMQLWATIRSLFLGNNRAFGNGGLEPPTIILPIDEAAIVRMFASTHDLTGEAERLAESFNEKTFDVTFHVNEPVMSDWRDYLRNKLNQAFGDFVSDEQAYWITKIVEDASAQKAIDGKITPRKIIKLINSVAALLSQWGREPINVLTMSFYVAHRAAVTRDVPAFLKGDHARMDAAVSDWRREIVALHFGVPPEKAYQTLLVEPLRAAFGNLDVDYFASLAAVPGAPQVIEDLIDDLSSELAPGGISADFIANAAILIGESTQRKEIWARRALEGLAAHWINAQLPTAWRPDFPELMKHLQPSDRRAPEFFAETGVKLGASISTQRPSDETRAAFATAVMALREAAIAYKQPIPKILLSLAPSDLFEMLGDIESADRPAIRSNKVTKDVVAEFVTMLSNEALAEKLPKLVRIAASTSSILYKDGQKFDWEPLVQTAHTNINGNELTHFATGPSLDVLGLLYTKHANAKALADAHFDSGRFSVLLNEADSEGEIARLADIAALMYLRGADFSGPSGKAWGEVPSAHDEFIGYFKSALHWYTWGDSTSYVLREQKNRGSFLPVMQLVVKDEVEEYKSGGIPTANLLNNLEVMERYLGPELITNAIADKSQAPEFWTNFEGMKVGRTLTRVVTDLANIPDFDLEKLATVVRAKLDAVDLPAWREAIQEDLEPIGLAATYRNNLGKTEALGDDLKQALSEQLPCLTTASPKMRRAWFTLSRHVSKNARATMYKNLRDGLLAGTLADADSLADLLLAGGLALTAEGKFADEPDKVARHIVLPMCGVEDGWEVVKRDAALYRAALTASEPDSRDEVREFLTAHSDSEVETSGRSELLTALGLADPKA